ncbi:MAG: isochorismate synthase [Myxococcota bacterium]
MTHLMPARQPESARDSARHWLTTSLARGASIITMQAPVAADVASAWPAAGDAILWDPPEGPALAGIGVSAQQSLDGAARFRQVDLDVLRKSEARQPGVTAPSPRLFGGFSFACGGASASPWNAFGDGRFVLPRWVYGVTGGSAFLRVHVDASSRDLESEFDALWTRLVRPEPLAAPEIAKVEAPPLQPWRDEIEAIRQGIEEGRLEKVVAASAAHITLATEGDPRRVLGRLRRRFPGCTRFAMRCGETTFLGATPERLLRREGPQVTTEALAGSAAPGRGEELLASDKDRHEHALVVQAIVAALSPHADQVRAADAPALHRLPNVVHLRTPIEAEVGDVDTLALVEALHPTPAVGGVPTQAALSFIEAHERPRGWYAAPFGWLDADGDGSFVVGLRSGVLQGTRAWAFVGCGIVSASEPAAEHEEALLKLGAFLGALGDDRGE